MKRMQMFNNHKVKDKEYEHFFAHLVDITDIEAHLDQTDLSDEEKQELVLVVHKTIHIEVMKMALDEIPEKDRETFLEFAEKRPHDDGLLMFLNRSIDSFEDRAQDLIHHIKLEFIDFLHEYREASRTWLEGPQIKKF